MSSIRRDLNKSNHSNREVLAITSPLPSVQSPSTVTCHTFTHTYVCTHIHTWGGRTVLLMKECKAFMVGTCTYWCHQVMHAVRLHSSPLPPPLSPESLSLLPKWDTHPSVPHPKQWELKPNSTQDNTLEKSGYLHLIVTCVTFWKSDSEEEGRRGRRRERGLGRGRGRVR